MKKPKTHVAIYTTVAKKLGLKTEKVLTGPNKSVLMISNDSKFFLASAAAPGLYPNVQRWNAHFCGSKLLSQKMLKRLGYKTIPSTAVRVAEHSSQTAFLQALTKKRYSFPLLLKPDKGIMGQGIAIIENIQQLQKVALQNYKAQSDFMLQPILDATEYRILVVNGKTMLMHSKHNPSVTGNGKSTIHQLLLDIPKEKKDANFIAWQYAKTQAKPNTILAKDSKFEYHITKKPTTEFYETTTIPRHIQSWAQKLAKDITSPVVGIDVFIPENMKDTEKYTIIELNSNPGVNYLETYCNDTKIAETILESVLRDYFKIK